MIPLQIGLYVIVSLKKVDVEVEDFRKFKFNTKSFNPYDPHGSCGYHYVRVSYSWIHVVCHWPEEDPWRYCYNSYRLIELIIMEVNG